MTTVSIDRHEQTQKLKEFIENSRKRVSSIVSSLGWSVESISKDVKNMIVCPFNESHHISEKSSEKHLQDCQWKAEGYGRHDLPLSIPTLPPGSSSTIKFDEQLLDDVIQTAKRQNPTMMPGVSGRLIPRTSDRLIAEFTREERCAMYEYVIANTSEPDIGDDISDMNKPKSSGDGKTSSYLELLAQERNLKRRRAKYRGVHTNKKSQIEILREVVNHQMEMLADYLTEKRDEASDHQPNNLPNKDLSRVRATDGDAEKRHYYPSRSVSVAKEQSFSTDNNDTHYQDHSSKRSEISIARGRSPDDRRYDGGSNGTRDRHWQREDITDIKMCRKERARSDKREQRDSSERRFYKSSHKRHKHKSKDCHEPAASSREREKSHSSRDSKYDDRRSVSTRFSRCDDRRAKKKRTSRSR